VSERESLKSCPFCGGEAEIGDVYPYEHNPFVACASCPAEITQATLSEAIAAWNTRARPEPSEAVVAEAMLAELRRQAKETRGNPFLYDENGLTDTTIDGEVDLIALARAALEVMPPAHPKLAALKEELRASEAAFAELARLSHALVEATMPIGTAPSQKQLLQMTDAALAVAKFMAGRAPP